MDAANNVESELYLDTAAEENIELYEGKKFPSFDDIQDFLSLRHRVLGETWKVGEGSRRIEISNKKIKDRSRHYRKSFKYSFIYYRCDKGGTHVGKITDSSQTKRG